MRCPYMKKKTTVVTGNVEPCDVVTRPAGPLCEHRNKPSAMSKTLLKYHSVIVLVAVTQLKWLYFPKKTKMVIYV